MAVTAAAGRLADALALRYADLVRRRRAGDASVACELEGVQADLADAIGGLVRAEVRRVWRRAGCRCAADRDDLEGWLWWGAWKTLDRYDGRGALSNYLGEFGFRKGRAKYQGLNRVVLVPPYLIYGGRQRRRAGAGRREAADRVLAATTSDAMLPALGGREESAGEVGESIEIVRAVLAAIPAGDRELLLSLRDFGGDESFSDAARRRGRSRQAVSQLTRRILDRLRVRLEAAGITEADVG